VNESKPYVPDEKFVRKDRGDRHHGDRRGRGDRDGGRRRNYDDDE
jgi:hypothetical protein